VPVLTLDAAVRDAVVAHARRDHPDEACGLIVGPAGSGRAERVVEMVNAARSMTQFEFEPGEQLRVYRELDDRDEEVVVVYHSHTATEAYPSRTDVRYASQPDAHYLLVSTRDPGAAEVRSYRIIEGTVTEEEVRVTGDSSGKPAAPAAVGP
jgi:proteasome lid subunit RPN8/RPN11